MRAKSDDDMLRENVSLKAYNTFGIDVKARWFIEIDSVTLATEFLVDNLNAGQDVYLLGGGSNLLLTDDLPGLVLRNRIMGKEVIREDEQFVYLKVGAGENWHELVLYCLEQHWGGIENLSLIPGCVGAAPIQNIGAYGVELKDVFVELETLSLATGNPRHFDAKACAFGYRDSYFKGSGKGKFLITSVTLRLNKAPHQLNTSYGAIETELARHHDGPYTIQDVSKAVIAIRQSKLPDPAEIGNSGSFFKNPVISAAAFGELQSRYPEVPHYPQADGQIKVPAGWLIEQAGWKGNRIGDYGVHERQALVLVNYGGASGQDIYALSEQIMQSVLEQFQ
ncbi:MAG: UDP-N-acetylmuramate dehydrogenase, partial [Bacteroidota bacterium]